MMDLTSLYFLSKHWQGMRFLKKFTPSCSCHPNEALQYVDHQSGDESFSIQLVRIVQKSRQVQLRSGKHIIFIENILSPSRHTVGYNVFQHRNTLPNVGKFPFCFVASIPAPKQEPIFLSPASQHA
jgi:hypothetical protein